MMNSSTQIETFGFGETPSGETAKLFVLSRKRGLKAKITNFGGILTELHVPDKTNNYLDVVLGFRDIATYVNENIYAGAIVGRIAGRVTKGLCPVEDKLHQLTINCDDYHVHGGLVGIDKRLWQAEIIEWNNDKALQLVYYSPDGEEGYPGNVAITVVYELSEEGGLRINFRAVTDRSTPLCLTNHSYFNLSREDNVLDHIIQIDSNKVIEVDNSLLPTGKTKPVEANGNDFRKAARLRDRISEMHLQHGDNYVLKNTAKAVKKVARLSAPSGSLHMDILTNTSNLQLYTGVSLASSEPGKKGSPYGKYAGLCFECQDFSDAENHAGFPSILLEPEVVYEEITEYRFQTND